MQTSGLSPCICGASVVNAMLHTFLLGFVIFRRVLVPQHSALRRPKLDGKSTSKVAGDRLLSRSCSCSLVSVSADRKKHPGSLALGLVCHVQKSKIQSTVARRDWTLPSIYMRVQPAEIDQTIASPRRISLYTSCTSGSIASLPRIHLGLGADDEVDVDVSVAQTIRETIDHTRLASRRGSGLITSRPGRTWKKEGRAHARRRGASARTQNLIDIGGDRELPATSRLHGPVQEELGIIISFAADERYIVYVQCRL
ncbi:hypothetical protein K438DRAFT_101750 [Mycena galopus ATCC 62051]|nr:hypothetical protein K438DRAFT_101750 [Mycena galopus ATCC 62051]